MRDLPVTGASDREMHEAVKNLIRGLGNYILTVTLAPNTSATTVNNDKINANASAQLCPMTANAAAALATTYVSVVAPGVLTLSHATSAQTDRTFRIAMLGG